MPCKDSMSKMPTSKGKAEGFCSYRVSKTDRADICVDRRWTS